MPEPLVTPRRDGINSPVNEDAELHVSVVIWQLSVQNFSPITFAVTRIDVAPSVWFCESGTIDSVVVRTRVRAVNNWRCHHQRTKRQRCTSSGGSHTYELVNIGERNETGWCQKNYGR